MANVGLMRRTLEAAERAEGTWDQRHWRLVSRRGTVMCFAGHVVELAGVAWVVDDPDDTQEYQSCALIPYGAITSGVRKVWPERGTALRARLAERGYDPQDWAIVRVPALARDLLGLPQRWETRDLFEASNTIEDLRRIVAQYEEQAQAEVHARLVSVGQ